MMSFMGHAKIIALSLTYTVCSAASMAASVSGMVTDQNGKRLEHAVITIVGEDTGLVSENAVMPPPIMTQQNIRFTPFVLPVAAGTTVSFPNKDKIRHHVYSFSKVKRFELELYGEDEEKTVLFDAQGVVALGCNIHDNMLAYIYIARSNIFARTANNGTAMFENLGPGTYSVYVWHPRLRGSEKDYVQQITVNSDGEAKVSFEIPLKRERNRSRSVY